MLDLQGKINGNDIIVVSDASLAAAMLGALSDADWGVEKAAMKDKASISPSVIIAKCHVDWPGKVLHKNVGSINFGYSGIGYGETGLLTPPSLSTNIVGAANFGISGPPPPNPNCCHP